MTTHTNAEALHQAAHEWAIEAYNKGLGRPCDIDGKRLAFDAMTRSQAQEIERLKEAVVAFIHYDNETEVDGIVMMQNYDEAITLARAALKWTNHG